MIINIRGTSGSGKTTLVRKVFDHLQAGNHTKTEWHLDEQDWSHPLLAGLRPERERKRPWGYVLENRERRANVVVLGSYESECGGCDSISGLDLMYGLARLAHERRYHVIFEGLIINSDFKRAAQLATDQIPHLLIYLSTPLEQCIQSVEHRRNQSKRAEKFRAAGGEMPAFNPANTRAKYDLNLKMIDRMRAAGVSCLSLARDEAFLEISKLLAEPWTEKSGKVPQ
jgi:ABC-type dipeptide/oligopeptide/nickel transport system ATPase component